MRLTIRTLLGYMDDILDPQDAEEIGRRIEESEVATTLYHRIRDVTRRLSLKAPDLNEDGGDGMDPNTVAEYLDNVLPDDRVPDFEKVCLDSDMHLAEVAACHQILAVALGEAAEIDPASREHMYLLPQVAADLENMDRPRKDPLGLNLDEAESPITNIPRRPSPIVPDYLREKPRRIPMVPIVMGTIVVVCLLLVVLAITGVLAPLGINPTGEEVAKNDGQTTLQQGEETPTAPSPMENQPEENVPSGEAPDIVTPSTEAFPSGQQEELPLIEDATSDVSPISPPNGLETPSTEENPPSTEEPSTTNIPGVIGEVNPATPTPGEGLAPTPVPENPTNPADLAGQESGSSEGTETPSGTQEEHTLIGRFVSENQALVQLDPADQSWRVVPQQGVLVSPTPLVALPTFRPIIATASGLSVQLLSETQVTMQPTKIDAMPVLKLQQGRIVLRSLGKPDLRLLLTAGSKTGIVTLVNPDSAAAVELISRREPGLDPIEVPTKVEIRLFVISGTVLWEEGGADQSEPLKVDASEYVTFSPEATTPKLEVLAEGPDWIKGTPVSKLDQSASEEILKSFATNPIASLALREQLDHRHREVSRLALKSLTQLGELETAVASLDDASRKLTWDLTIQQLFDLASQSPEMAKQVHQAFEREYGDAAQDLWRMLWGYTPQQLVNDGAIQLVEYLDHDRLVFRVMSFYNLKMLTGKTLYYEPDETPIRRNTPLQRWQSELQKGKIIPETK